MIWDGKHIAKADTLATSLFEEFVEKPIGSDIPLSTDNTLTTPLERKIRLYQFACVLLAVLDAERSNPAFSQVREIFESKFFPPTFAEGAELLDEVKHAMKDLSDLIQPVEKGKSNPMSWGLKWLNDIGIHQDNPATIVMFVLRWPHHYVAAVKALGKFDPFD